VEGFPRPRPRPRRRSAEPARGERGFVLIAAIWLLILAGSITAILMLRSLSLAAGAAADGDALARRLALAGAIETALADRIFNGERSPWWLTPSESTVAIGGRRVTVRLSSESGRLDVNEADPALIDAALRGAAVAPSERARIVTRLQAFRAANRRLLSPAALDMLLAEAGAAAGSCLPDQLTTSSGMAQPRPDQMPRALARALGIAGGDSLVIPEPGAPMRVEAAEAGGAHVVAVLRMSGTPERPVVFAAWNEAPSCSGLARRR